MTDIIFFCSLNSFRATFPINLQTNALPAETKMRQPAPIVEPTTPPAAPPKTAPLAF